MALTPHRPAQSVRTRFDFVSTLKFYFSLHKRTIPIKQVLVYGRVSLTKFITRIRLNCAGLLVDVMAICVTAMTSSNRQRDLNWFEFWTLLVRLDLCHMQNMLQYTMPQSIASIASILKLHLSCDSILFILLSKCPVSKIVPVTIIKNWPLKVFKLLRCNSVHSHWYSLVLYNLLVLF